MLESSIVSFELLYLAAGGIADDASVERARRLGLAPPQVFLDNNDSYAFLATLGDLILTGPTGTNLADVIVLMASPARLTSRL